MLSEAMNARLWTIAQHKHGWGCYGWLDYPSFEALERRGLVWCFDRRTCTDGQDSERRYELTAAGYEECARRFPVSPAVLRTYEPQPGGWTPREGVPVP
jgi:hypothetical protein